MYRFEPKIKLFFIGATFYFCFLLISEESRKERGEFVLSEHEVLECSSIPNTNFNILYKINIK